MEEKGFTSHSPGGTFQCGNDIFRYPSEVLAHAKVVILPLTFLYLLISVHHVFSLVASAPSSLSEMTCCAL